MASHIVPQQWAQASNGAPAVLAYKSRASVSGVPLSRVDGPAGYKVIETMHPEAQLTITSAEHQRRRASSGGGDFATFSSPFVFSQADSPKAITGPEFVVRPMPPPAYTAPPPRQSEQLAYGPTFMQAYHAGHMPAMSHPAEYDMTRIQQSRALLAPPPMFVAPPQFTQRYPVYAGMPQASPGQRQPLEGWLSKRGADYSQSFDPRWCSLHSGVSPEEFYLGYSHEERGPVCKQIRLHGGCQARPFMHPTTTGEGKMMWEKKPMGFELYTGDGSRTYFFDPGSKIKRDLWVTAINNAVALVAAMRPSVGMAGHHE